MLGLGGDTDAALRGKKLRALRRFLMLHGAARSWLWLLFEAPVHPALLALSATALCVCLVLSLSRRGEYLAPRLALPVLLLQLWWTFPITDNHFFIELLAVALLCLADRDSEADEVLVLQSLQWLTALVLFQTGLQKVLYGHYFGGEFLAFMVGQGDRFADLFALLVPASEVARLAGIDPLRTGAGPFRVESVGLILVSNLVYLTELVLPVALLLRRTRLAASLVAIVFVVTLQLAAREVGFALLFANLLLLFPERDWGRRLLPSVAGLYLYAIGAAAGWLPGG
ncbi:MAG: hypothetical protein O7B29_07070, partial [Deltaproteobacteria bacterium]|nr:hypothetical protein [Deltaproteobacteria bacterium]